MLPLEFYGMNLVPHLRSSNSKGAPNGEEEETSCASVFLGSDVQGSRNEDSGWHCVADVLYLLA